MGFLDEKIKTLDNGFQVLDMPDSVNFALVTCDKKVIISSQWRASCNSEHLNLFGGYVDKGENPLDTLLREMKEETNIGCFTNIFVIYENKKVSAGTTTEHNSLYVVFIPYTKNELLEKGLLKCNDKKENIKFVFVNGTINEFREYRDRKLEGVRSFILFDKLSDLLLGGNK
ncbi:MAG: NUDIX hydrolase [Clostridium chrysemydis]|uniref:NUDIX hydrolase n=1 Tax=Clostridium chrysemydis TaxID=2665504 RepID=UPI003F35AA40